MHGRVGNDPKAPGLSEGDMDFVSNEDEYGNLSMLRRRAQMSVPRPRSRPNEDDGGWKFDLGLASEAPIRGNWYGDARNEYTQESQVHLSLRVVS